MAGDWEGGVCKRYKTPVVKTSEDEAFYKWLNEHKNKNRLITRALRTLWKIDSGTFETCQSKTSNVTIDKEAIYDQGPSQKRENHDQLTTDGNIKNETVTNRPNSSLTLPSGSSLKNLTKLIKS